MAFQTAALHASPLLAGAGCVESSGENRVGKIPHEGRVAGGSRGMPVNVWEDSPMSYQSAKYWFVFGLAFVVGCLVALITGGNVFLGMLAFLVSGCVIDKAFLACFSCTTQVVGNQGVRLTSLSASTVQL